MARPTKRRSKRQKEELKGITKHIVDHLLSRTKAIETAERQTLENFLKPLQATASQTGQEDMPQ